MNIIQIFQKFPTQESCVRHLEKKRWGDIPVCVYCGSINTNPLVKELRHHCNGCRKSFSVTVDTIFHQTHIPLQKWFLGISLIQNAKKGISSRQLARDLELPVYTSWSMAHRIRKSMQDNGKLLEGIVEMDETYVGGKPRKENHKDDDNDKGNPRGRGTKKTPVVGMVEREGDVKAKAAAKSSLKAKDLLKLILQHINTKETILVTDEYTGYNNMNDTVPHLTINHSYEYAKGDVHTNTIESFWAIVKRGIMGQFHWVSKKYLNAYLDEFCYRYNTRNMDSSIVFDMTINRMLRK
jgi:transposase-like protein